MTTIDFVWRLHLFCITTYFVKVNTKAALFNGEKLAGCLNILCRHTKRNGGRHKKWKGFGDLSTFYVTSMTKGQHFVGQIFTRAWTHMEANRKKKLLYKIRNVSHCTAVHWQNYFIKVWKCQKLAILINSKKNIIIFQKELANMVSKIIFLPMKKYYPIQYICTIEVWHIQFNYLIIQSQSTQVRSGRHFKWMCEQINHFSVKKEEKITYLKMK